MSNEQINREVSGAPNPVTVVVAPATRAQGGWLRSQRFWMIVLGGVAVVLIGLGIAAPQFAHAFDALRYQNVIQAVDRSQVAVAERDMQYESATILLAVQQEELRKLSLELRKLTDVPTVAIPQAQKDLLLANATKIDQSIPKTVTAEVQRHLSEVNAAAKKDPQAAPLSWLDADEQQIRELLDLKAEKITPYAAHDIISSDTLAAVEQQRTAFQDEMRALDDEIETLREQSTKLGEIADTLAADTQKVAERLPEYAAIIVTDSPDVDTLHGAMTSAAEAAKRLAMTEQVQRSAQGKISQTTGTLPSGSQQIPVTPASRTSIVLPEVQRYTLAAIAVLDAQTAVPELDSSSPSTNTGPGRIPSPNGGFGAGAGANASAGAGANGSAGAGANGGAGAGIDPGAGAGVDPGAGAGAGAGVDPGAGAGVDPGAGAGAGVDPGAGAGVDPGAGAGAGVDPGAGAGAGAGVDPSAGAGAGVDPGAGAGGGL